MSIKIADGLYMVKRTIKQDVVVKEKAPINHIFLYDRSGSMSGVIRRLVEQLITIVKTVDKSDTVTIGWFSSEGGQRNFIVKGFRITNDADYLVLEKMLRQNNSTIGMTCFSEILEDTNTVIGDLKAFSDVFSLHFFTDGYPVVSNYNKEVSAIEKAIDNISGKINTAMLVGYGDYYNKELMSKMAERLGATLSHSSIIDDYAVGITQFLNLSGSVTPKVAVDVSDIPDIQSIYTVSDYGISLYTAKDGKVFLPLSSDGEGNLFILTTINHEPGDTVGDLRGAYGAACVLIQKAKADVAMEVMGTIGDKNLIDGIANAFTLEEYGNIESKIKECTVDESKRFLKGKDTNYLPKADAFCVLDIVEVLLKDEKASFFPYRDEFEYKRVSAPTVAREGYAKFEVNPNYASGIDGLTWNSTRLNLSVRTQVRGTIKLKEVDGKKASDFGFSDNFPVFQWKNYTLIGDGLVNVRKIPVVTSDETYKILKENGCVAVQREDEYGIYVIDLGAVPVINRGMAVGNDSATELAKLSIDELLLEARIKVWKNFLKTEAENVEESTISDEQTAYLEANGVGKGGVYEPPRDAGETTDSYTAKTFEIKIASFSSLPSINAVLKKEESKKNMTVSEQVVFDWIVEYRKLALAIKEDLRSAYIESMIASDRQFLYAIRSKIQKAKFAVILAKKWFKEFSSYEENTITLGDYKLTFALGDTTVKI